MFGFNKDNKEKQQRDKSIQIANNFIRSAIINQYGTDDPETINRIWRTYMPEITNAILEIKRAALNNERNITGQLGQNQVNIYNNIDIKHEELMAELKALREQNQESERRNKELQEKYNAILERMDKILAREEGKGR